MLVGGVCSDGCGSDLPEKTRWRNEVPSELSAIGLFEHYGLYSRALSNDIVVDGISGDEKGASLCSMGGPILPRWSALVASWFTSRREELRKVTTEESRSWCELEPVHWFSSFKRWRLRGRISSDLSKWHSLPCSAHLEQHSSRLVIRDERSHCLFCLRQRSHDAGVFLGMMNGCN